MSEALERNAAKGLSGQKTVRTGKYLRNKKKKRGDRWDGDTLLDRKRARRFGFKHKGSNDG